MEKFAKNKSTNLVNENLNAFKDLFPEAFAEGKVDFEVLKELLGSTLENNEEKYGLNWHGKRRARQLALTPSTGTLRPCPEESVNWNTTQNLMIEGDNLEVLKLLQQSYSGRVKVIYIDPPYNTGKDFIYTDDFRDNIKNYLKLTGQVDSENVKLSSNTESSGRFHTNWLNMMYPRLKIARNLLTQDGVILISIGDNEIHNLRSICDEILGYENFCGVFVWEKKKKPSFLNQNMGTVTDYIVAYAKDRPQSPAFTTGTVEEGKKYPFNNAGNSLTVLEFPAKSVNFGLADQVVKAQNMSEDNIKTELLNDVHIQNKTNQNPFLLRGEWRYSQSRLDEFVAAREEISISKIPFRPNYVNRSGEQKKTANLLSHRINSVPTNEDATQKAREIFGNDVVSYPKPEGLLQYLIRAVSREDDLVLDFFAGSGTTASGVWRQNIEDSHSRRFILVQLPKPLDVSDRIQEAAAKLCEHLGRPLNLAELTKEWLRRVGNKILDTDPDQDFGFRVFKLDTSNIHTWESNPDDLKKTLLDNIDHIKSDRSEEDILYELLLKLGLDLCTSIETRTIGSKTVRAAVGDAVLIACLEEEIVSEEVEPLALGIVEWQKQFESTSDVTVVFRDSAFLDDVAKINMVAILLQHGLKTIRSL